MIEGQRQRQQAVRHDPAVGHHRRRADPPGAEDRDLRRDDDERGEAAGEHAEIGQGDGLPAQFGDRHGARPHIGLHALKAPPQIGGVAGADIAQHRDEQPLLGVDGDAEIDLRPSYQALRPGEAATPATIARTSRIVTSVFGGQASMSASSTTVAGTISACARAILSAIARRTPERSSAGACASAARAARSTSALVTVPLGPLGVSAARSTPSRCANARTAGAALTAGLAATGSAPRGGAAAGGAAAASSPTTVPVSARGPSSNSTSGAPTLMRSPGLA